MLTLFFVFTFGMVEFLLAYWQWSSAVKAVQWGARIAAVSDPVAGDLEELDGLEDEAAPGDPFPPFTMTCDGKTSECTGSDVYNAAAMNAIVFGRNDLALSCAGGGGLQTLGMCDLFYRIRPANVRITYEWTGLGFAGRPGGAVPTITVSLQDLEFEFLFLGDLIGLGDITMPGMTTTITGEDLRSTAPDF